MSGIPISGGGNSILYPDSVAQHFHGSHCKSGQASGGKMGSTGKRSTFILALIHNDEDLNQTFNSLSKTVTNCQDLFRPGLYHPANIIFFYILTNGTKEAGKLTDLIFNVHYIQNHPRGVAFYHAHGNSHPVLFQYNIYQSQQKKTLIQDQRSLQEIASDFPMQVCVNQYKW